MWLAAAADPPTEVSHALITAVLAFAGVVATVTGGVIVALINRNAKVQPSPPAPTAHPDEADIKVRERVAILERRADDADDRDEMQDRRLDQLERHLDVDNPEWRHRGRH